MTYVWKQTYENDLTLSSHPVLSDIVQGDGYV